MGDKYLNHRLGSVEPFVFKVSCQSCGDKMTFVDYSGNLHHYLAIAQAENRKLWAIMDELSDKIGEEIRIFQDVIGWQPHESRNALICRIAEKIETIVREIVESAKAPETAKGAEDVREAKGTLEVYHD